MVRSDISTVGLQTQNSFQLVCGALQACIYVAYLELSRQRWVGGGGANLRIMSPARGGGKYPGYVVSVGGELPGHKSPGGESPFLLPVLSFFETWYIRSVIFRSCFFISPRSIELYSFAKIGLHTAATYTNVHLFALHKTLFYKHLRRA